MGREEWAGTQHGLDPIELAKCNQGHVLELHSSWELHLATTADLGPSIHQASVSLTAWFQAQIRDN